MPDSTYPTLRRISHTPMRDVLRLRMTGRLDWKLRVAHSGLPEPIADLICRVVKQTRLWRLEKAAAADELIAHFGDGLAAGSTVEQLLERFGDARLAAKVIRSARRRAAARRDWKSRLAAANLPQPVSELIGRVVKRTRLWRLEKVAVADELIAHFSDGLPAGSTVEQLLERFGNERLAAKLIRRAKRRCRPWPWHVRNVLFRATAVALVIYAALMIRFCVSGPTISVDYIANMNEHIAGIPPGERAWPLWREAILACSDSAPNKQVIFSKAVVYNDNEKPHWPDTVEWLDKHSAGIELARQAAGKPAMGFLLGPNGSAADPGMGWTFHDQTPNEPLLFVLLPHLNYLRNMNHVLFLDARLAAERGDGARVEADVMAMLGLGRQLRGPDSFLVTQGTGLWFDIEAIRRLRFVLVNHPALFKEDQLICLAHALAGPRVAADLMTFKPDRGFFADIVQRSFTDDGHGNGHMTLAGVHFLAEIKRMISGDDSRGLPAWEAVSTAPLLSASRAQLMAVYDQFADQAEANLQQPIRNADLRGVNSHFAALTSSPTSWFRFNVLSELMPVLTGSQRSCETYLGERDGVVVGIALELFRRRQAHYPAALSELTPGLLPEIPADRITGDPVKYKLIDGKPVVYSVGADRIDDGGRAPDKSDLKATFVNTRPASWGVDPKNVARGDWLLYAPDLPDPDAN
jgi:uncharacterized membrane protein